MPKRIIKKETQREECEKFKIACQSDIDELSGEDWCDVPYYFHVGKNKLYPNQSQCHDLDFLIKTWEGQLGFQTDGWPAPQWPQDPYNRRIISIDKFLELTNYYESLGYELPFKIQILVSALVSALNALQDENVSSHELWKPFLDGTLKIEDPENKAKLQEFLLLTLYPEDDVEEDLDYDENLLEVEGSDEVRFIKAFANAISAQPPILSHFPQEGDLFDAGDLGIQLLEGLGEKLEEGLDQTQDYIWDETINFLHENQIIYLTDDQMTELKDDFYVLIEILYDIVVLLGVDWETFEITFEFLRSLDPTSLFENQFEREDYEETWKELFLNSLSLLKPGMYMSEGGEISFITNLVESLSNPPRNPERLKRSLKNALNRILF